MITGKKLLLVSQRKLTLSPDNCKNDTAELHPTVPGVPGGVGGFVVFCVYSVF